MLLTLLSSIGDMSPLEFIMMLISYAAVIFVSLPVHEFAHALAADLLGDKTARWHGRLRLNPLAHLDPWGTALILLIGVGYARPVPVNTYNFCNRKRDMALTALAGPLSNFLMAVAAVGLFRVVLLLPVSGLVVEAAYMVLVAVFASVNISLMLFNLIPIPPLDGSRLLGLVLPERLMYQMERYSRYLIMLIMLLSFSGVLDGPLNLLHSAVFNLLFRIFGI